MSVKLSVVVPVYNVEEYLRECLESLAGQTLRDLEVVVVDDGSLDGSATIAKDFAARDDRFRLVQQPNQGLGGARNTGVQHACGEYLAFVDSDDVVPPGAYELLVSSLERTGSALATGNVLRMDGDRTWQSFLHENVFKTAEERTHITRRPLLVRDRCAWNKVFRRSFWDEQGLVFPSGLYEDSPVVLPAHLAAASVDVLEDVVYHWRKREGSITEGRSGLDNYRQRTDTALSVRDHVKQAAPGLLPAYDEHVLIDVELRVLLEGLPRVPDEELAGLVELGGALAALPGEDVVDGLPSLTRVQLHLLERRMTAELLEFRRFLQLGGAERTRLVRRGLRPRWYAEYPFFEDRERGVPADLYDVTDELAAVARVDRFEWAGDRLRVEGHAYIEGLDAPDRSDSRVRLWLVADDRRGLLRVPAQRVRRPDVTAAAGRSTASHEWAGFTAEIDPDALTVFGRRRQVDWRLVAEISCRGVRRRTAVAAPRAARYRWPLQREIGGGLRVQAIGAKGFRLRVRRHGAVLTGHRRDGGDLELTGVLPDGPGRGVALVALAPKENLTVAGLTALAPLPEGGYRFTARFPLAMLAAAGQCGRTEGAGTQRETTWTFELTDGTKLLLDDGPSDARHLVGEGRELALTRTKHGNLSAVVRPVMPVLVRARWEPGETLALTGTWSGGDPRPDTLVLRRRRSSQEHVLPLSWSGERFSAVLYTGRLPVAGVELPLGRGHWYVFARAGERELSVLVERAAMRELPEPRVAGLHEIDVHATKTDALLLRVKVALADDERGPYAQERLQTVDYPYYRTLPVRDMVLFDAYNGRQLSCNPRGVFEELRRRETGTECVWVTRDGQFPPPEGARTVLADSREHYEALARARLIVGNWRQQPWFAKREGQTYVMCWHGTPLKKVGYDLKEMPYKRTEGVDWMKDDVPQWDFLLAQNEFSVPLLRSAFRYEGEILVSGYPRNDLLKRPGTEEIAARVRERLGVPPGKRVVMYAPTWRDDFHFEVGKRAFQLELDVERAAAELGDDHVLLLRTHYLVTDKPRRGENPFVIDVSDYPDIADLYLITDVFVTDYSSSMFDFAVTGRPMLFYTYDLERYRDHVRGFYFDFEAEAPGPLLRDSGEVIAALRDLDGVRARHRDAYAAFQAKFCPHDDGRAAARVLDRVL
ncbi:bifunctional glycosyltransferase/CDP-glycerol:glycerophosphate glycerophosphotransferase [Actinomadura macrotermitis]|uniref:Undecaprenyl-phosphate 4-deoxy-4-formamido-L-arabinose transferase n=1 Tax=Actinomadura macrotermitis TaxID=2585200 RepID=A0A7K0C229_9ACTN|nr:bifunctional glycosyltransferase/CDP-glycerol:glycerophosphate glycerophosphotransferase [Actinomadura macrotermitis]MQY07521.1 Undecaprenyl-phosphate 4-deoxy-4-formamido-L-arabinose transferase [Actinomadura macrotermitis]